MSAPRKALAFKKGPRRASKFAAATIVTATEPPPPPRLPQIPPHTMHAHATRAIELTDAALEALNALTAFEFMARAEMKFEDEYAPLYDAGSSLMAYKLRAQRALHELSADGAPMG